MQARSSFRSLNIRLFALSAFLLSSLGAFGQSYYGGIRGTVADQNGGVVGAAKVTLTAEGTGTLRSTVSSQSGEFVFTEVPPATYTVTVESPGFKRFDRKGVVVGTQQQVS